MHPHNFKKSFIPKGLDRYPFHIDVIVEQDWSINVYGLSNLPSRMQELIKKEDVVNVPCVCGCGKRYPALPLEKFQQALATWKQEGNVIFN